MTERNLDRLLTALIVVIILALMASCRTAQYHLQKAIEKGAVIDTVVTIGVDTITADSVRDRIVIRREIDYAALDSLCQELTIIPSSSPEKKRAAGNIVKTVCPEMKVDTTYIITLLAQGQKYQLPIQVKIAAQGGVIDYTIKSGTLKVPVRTESNHTTIKAPTTGWRGIFGYVIAFVVGLAGGLYLARRR